MWDTGAGSANATKKPFCNILAFLRGNPPHVTLVVQCLSLGKCEETVSAVCSGLHVLPLFKGVWGRHPTPIDPAYYNSCGPAPHLSSECLSLLQRLQLNINPTTAGEAIKIEGVIFQKATPNKDEDKDGYPNRRRKKKWSYPGNSAPCQGAGASFLRGLRLLYQTCTDWIATAWPTPDLDK